MVLWIYFADKLTMMISQASQHVSVVAIAQEEKYLSHIRDQNMMDTLCALVLYIGGKTLDDSNKANQIC